jgi:multiple sugar transport system permease protein
MYTMKRKYRSAILPYMLIMPLLLFIGVLSVYPMMSTFVESFFDVSPLTPFHFVGIKNYIDTLHDPTILHSWSNTLLYMAIGTVLSTLLALVIAMALQDRFKARALILGILVLPWAFPAVTEGIIWDWIYNPDFGVLNSVLSSLHLIDQYQLWISVNRFHTIFFIELVQVWQMTPLAVILLLAGLQSIPADLYEAAKVDGAGKLRTAFTITLPLLRPSITIAVVQAVITSINIFDQVWVLNADAPTGQSIMRTIYDVAFQNLNFGQGYALSFSAVVVTMAVSLLMIKLIYRRVEY